jgi:peroxiredoxin-like protein
VQPYPHQYTVTGAALPGPGSISIRTTGAPVLVTSLPAEFDGPGDQWSPESLLVAAAADCYLFTFRGIATKSRLAWTQVSVVATGTLDRIDNASRFTHISLRVQLELPEQANIELARRVATRAEETCLVTRSLSATTSLSVSLVQPEPAHHGT